MPGYELPQTHLRDGTHAQLVKCAGEEGSKGGHKGNSAVTAGGTDAHSHQILLSNEALNIPANKGFAFKLDRGESRAGLPSAEKVLTR